MDVLGPVNNVLFNLSKAQTTLLTDVTDLSSGLRINSAADDPSGLAISQTLQAASRGLTQGTASVQDARNAITVADGGFQTITDIVQRMRSLVISANTDLSSDADKQNVQAELDQLKKEINSISQNTTFNGKPLLNGSLSQNQPPQNAQVNEVTADLNPNTGLTPPTNVTNATGVGTPGPLVSNTVVGNNSVSSYIEFTVTGLDPTGTLANVRIQQFSNDPSWGPAIDGTAQIPLNAGQINGISVTNWNGSIIQLTFSIANITAADV
ncbi:MAG: flagellin, partial [Candidatus Eremiobacteraeota bacterium]|nr:flagellin [Candidatus Eremiobacteraeota bacterium]